LPEWRSVFSPIEPGGHSIPDEYLISFDARDCSPEEWEMLKQIATSIEARAIDRENRTVEGSLQGKG